VTPIEEYPFDPRISPPVLCPEFVFSMNPAVFCTQLLCRLWRADDRREDECTVDRAAAQLQPYRHEAGEAHGDSRRRGGPGGVVGSERGEEVGRAVLS
jgi:hypothetical protein